MKLNLTLKDLVKYIIFIGIVYTILKIMPSKQINLQDLFLVILIIVGSVIFFHCFYNKETFQNADSNENDENAEQVVAEGDNIKISTESEDGPESESEDGWEYY
jgi:uncharacterized membrane protein YcaP (DUF421 family)